MRMQDLPIRIVILASGFGSNLQAIVDAIKENRLSAQVIAVISDQANAYALERARKEDILPIFIDAGQYPQRHQFDAVLQSKLERLDPDLIVLAGFMRILSATIVNRFRNRMMNIHPSLLPRHKGLNTHERVLKEGDSCHGASVHFVTPELDDGPIILQREFNVNTSDTVEDLERRVHEIEHKIYPEAIKMFAEGTLSVIQGKVICKDKQ